jgi:hypothetical protein
MDRRDLRNKSGAAVPLLFFVGAIRFLRRVWLAGIRDAPLVRLSVTWWSIVHNPERRGNLRRRESGLSIFRAR